MKKTILFFILIASFTQLNAATKMDNCDDKSYESGILLEPRSFWNNWFLELGVGASIYIGEDDKKVSPALDISAGKWFTPLLGTRIGYSGLSFKNGDQKFNYQYYHADVMFNISNAIKRYKEDRCYSFIPYLGFGVINNADSKETAFAGNLGIQNKFRLSPKFDANLDLKGLVVGEDSFDGQLNKDGGMNLDGAASITVGVTYNFGKKDQPRWKKAVSPEYVDCVKSNYLAQLAEVEDKLSNEKMANDKLNKELAQAKKDLEAARANTTSVPQLINLSTYVSFKIGCAKVSEEDKVNLLQLAKFINDAPSDKQFIIVGYADNKTGSEKRNLELSKLRAEAVKAVLVEKFNVPADKLKVEYKGGVDNMFFDKAKFSRSAIIY